MDSVVRVCGDYLGGVTGHPARPQLVVHVDMTQSQPPPRAGLVELAAPESCPP